MTRQKEQFLVLMANQELIQKALTTETNATGLATERYGIYMEGVEASQNRLTASWERMATSGATKEMIVNINNLGTAILDLISNLGGIPTILSLIATGFVAIQANAIAAGLATLSLEIATTSLASVLAAISAVNPITWIALAIGAGVIAFNVLYESAEETRIKLGDMNKELEDMALNVTNAANQKKQIESLGNEYDELNKKLKLVGLTNDEQERYIDLQNEIHKISPDVAGSYDEEGNYILAEGVNLKVLIELKKEEIRLMKEKLSLEADKNIEEQTKKYMDLQDQIKNTSAAINDLNDPTGKTAAGIQLSKASAEERKKELLEYMSLSDEVFSSIKRSFYIKGGESQLEYLNGLRGKGDEYSLMLADILQKEINDAHPLEPITIMPGVEPELINTVKTEYDLIMEAAQNAFDKRSKLEKEFTLIQIDEAIKRARAIGAEKSAIDNLIAYRQEIAQSLLEEEKKSYDQTVKNVVSMLKQRANAEKDALQQQLKNIKTEYDRRKQALKDRYDAEKRNHDAQKQSIQDEIDNVKNVISAQKDLLDAKRAEEDFNDSIAEKGKNLGDIQAQIAMLQFDTSAEGIAKRLKLEEEAAAIKKDMDKEQLDRTRGLEDQALTQMEQEYQAKQDHRIRDIEDEQDAADQRYQIQLAALEREEARKEESLQNKIASIDRYLSQEGALNTQAMAMIQDNASQTYSELIEWNALYGDGLNSTITTAWMTAIEYLNLYKAMAMGLSFDIPSPDVNELFNPSAGQGDLAGQPFWNNPTPKPKPPKAPYEHHSGIESGTAGGLKVNETIAKLTKDELIFKPDQLNNLIKNLIGFGKMPEFKSLNSGGNIEVNMPINVAGNLDKTVLPDIEKLTNKVIQKINDSMKSRGNLRTTSLTSI